MTKVAASFAAAKPRQFGIFDSPSLPPSFPPSDGAVDFNQLLDYLNQAPQVAVNLKSEILQTLLGVFQLDSGKKAVFREVSGFHYMISVLASLLGSLAPRRVNPWTTGEDFFPLPSYLPLSLSLLKAFSVPVSAVDKMKEIGVVLDLVYQKKL